MFNPPSEDCWRRLDWIQQLGFSFGARIGWQELLDGLLYEGYDDINGDNDDDDNDDYEERASASQYYMYEGCNEWYHVDDKILLWWTPIHDHDHHHDHHHFQENRCFPPDVNLKDVLDLYFQSCSLEVTMRIIIIMILMLLNKTIKKYWSW